jgi:hypothetical protein
MILLVTPNPDLRTSIGFLFLPVIEEGREEGVKKRVCVNKRVDK